MDTSSLYNANATNTAVDSHSHGGFEWPSPVGLCLGLLSVAVGQVVVLVFQYLRVVWNILNPIHVQTGAKKRPYEFWEGVSTHLAQPEGFIVLTTYLSATWMLNWMPKSYYSFEGGVNWVHVLQQLLIQVCNLFLLLSFSCRELFLK